MDVESEATIPKVEEIQTSALPLMTINVYGMSMFPTLLSGERVLVIKVPIATVCHGDILLTRRPNGDGHIVHRLVRTQESDGILLFTKGDTCEETDPPVGEDYFQGKVIGVWRNDRLEWLSEENSSASRTHESKNQLGSRASVDKWKETARTGGKIHDMKVLDLRTFACEDIALLHSVNHVSKVLLSPNNVATWENIDARNIRSISVVPEGIRTFTGQVDIFGSVLRQSKSPIKMFIDGQVFFNDTSEEDIHRFLDYIMLTSFGFACSRAVAKALLSKLRHVGGRAGRVVVMPEEHRRWIGEAAITSETIRTWRHESLIVIGPLTVSREVKAGELEDALDTFYCAGAINAEDCCMNVLSQKQAEVLEG